jgi:CNT family concentrative nucleoside transporter
MLIAFLGLVAVINWLLAGVGGWFGMDYLTLEWLLGWIFYPIALVMGVEWGEVTTLAQLIGEKLVLTELVAYKDLGRMVSQGQINPRTQMIASFALCGFANLGSVAIQIGGLGAMAPDRKGDIARLALRAMFAGTLATCMTACLAGVMGIVKIP